jgi:hypothetical protein
MFPSEPEAVIYGAPEHGENQQLSPRRHSALVLILVSSPYLWTMLQYTEDWNELAIESRQCSCWLGAKERGRLANITNLNPATVENAPPRSSI